MKNESSHEYNEREVFSEKWLTPFQSDPAGADMLRSEYLARFGQENEVIFEHCSAYMNKILHDPRFTPFLLNTEQTNLALTRESGLELMNPAITPQEFENFYGDAKTASIPLTIRGISEAYIKSNDFLLGYKHDIMEHSSEEAILSTEKTATLIGKDYGSLRQNVNKIEKTGKCDYLELTDETPEELQLLFSNWLATQGGKYNINREESDLEYLKFFMNNKDNPNFMTRLVRFDGRLCGAFLGEIVRSNSAVGIINKCLNGFEIDGQTYGMSGLSRYMYFKACQELNGKGVKFMNIGSMGSEAGTRYTKQILRPLEKMSTSYQINYS